MFTIHVDDLDEGTKCTEAGCTNDTKIVEEDIKNLERDIDRLREWARIWQLEYNVAK